MIPAERLRIARADSASDTSAAVRARIALSELVRPKESRPLLEEAAALAEGAGDLPLAIQARERLAALHAASAAHRSASEELSRIIRLRELRDREDSLALAAAHRNAIAAQQQAHAAERQRLYADLQAAQDQAVANRSLAARWARAAAGLGIAWALTIAGLLFLLQRQRTARNELSEQISGLRSRVAELAGSVEALAAQAKEPAAPAAKPSPIAAPDLFPAPSPRPAMALDPLVIALFKRQAPERIATLQAARAAGDHEKALRVLHSLRPQLDALDPDGLGALCADIRAMPPASAARDASLDRLIAGLNELLLRD